MTWVGIIVGAVVGLIGGAVSAYGSYAQGQAQKKMNQYQADIAEQQAKIEARTADQNITAVQDQAAMEAKRQRRDIAMLEGEQKGVLAAQGVGGGSVTSNDITRSTDVTAEEDAIAIRYNADYKSWALKTGADFNTWDLSNQKNQYLMAGSNAARAGAINATSSLISSASQGAATGASFTYKGSSGKTKKA